MAVDFLTWQGITAPAIADNWANYGGQGYRFVALSVYGTAAAPQYAAVVVQRPVLVTQFVQFEMTMSELMAVNDAQYGQDMGLRILTATGTADNPVFAGVWEPTASPILDPYFNLDQPGLASLIYSSRFDSSGNALESTTIPISIDVYGDAGDRRYAVIMAPNPAAVSWDATSWNSNGVEDSAAAYQTRFDVQTEDGMRVFQVSPSGDGYYASAFRDDQIGAWYSYNSMTLAGYEQKLGEMSEQGFFPISVQAGGSGTGAEFAAIFTTTEEITPRNFTVTGLPASAPADPYDAAMETLMMTYNVRQAALALVQGTRLVLARGYTYAEPGYPITEPDNNTFWIASCSKTFTSLLIHQLVYEGALSLDDTLQSILNLQAPAGDPPTDDRFNLITVEMLLDHTSGVVDGASPGTILASFPGAQVPVTEAQLASWECAQGLVDGTGAPLVGEPGTYAAWFYDNAGYDLLGQIVENKRDMSYADAVTTYITVPLGLERTWLAPGTLSAQPADQVRQVCGTIPLVPSQIIPGQPLQPFGYDNNFAISAGAGGLASSVIDMARVLAALNDTSPDNPLLDPSEIIAMFQAAAQTLPDANGNQVGLRAHGWDHCCPEKTGGVQLKGSTPSAWYAQKGGSYAGAGATLRHSTTGISMALLLAHQPIGQQGQSYPDFPAVIHAAEGQDWGDTDLFPQFGMDSLG
jgi:CubicO group peptidase (beta-lactamase class C family)